MRTFAVLVVGASMTLATMASGQTQTPPPAAQKPAPSSQLPAPEQEKKIEGQVKSINSARTEITLTDGTKLVAPVGAVIKPGLLDEGATVIAKYTGASRGEGHVRALRGEGPIGVATERTEIPQRTVDSAPQ